MRHIVLLLFVMMLLPLNACSQQGSAPAEVFIPVENIPAASAVPSPIPTTATPFLTEEMSMPTLTVFPIEIMQASEAVQEFSLDVTQPLIITIVYVNNSYDQRLTSAWGFSALIEYRGHHLLFDTGGEGKILMENMRLLGIDPILIESVVLSHAHGDHTGGLTALLDSGAKPPVYLLPSFPASFKRQIEPFTRLVEVVPGQAIADGIWTTGEMGWDIREQALVIQTEQGLVVITGCAHPGIVSFLEQAQSMFAEPLRLVMGGFHLQGKGEGEISAILQDFRRLAVEQVAPCHCTGEKAIARFKVEYGDNFIELGVGSVIKMFEGDSDGNIR